MAIFLTSTLFSLSMISLKTDILIAGGGPAGVPCAVAAAREGAKVVLVQDRPMLGGNASSEIRMHIVGADAFGGRELEVEAREGGILEELRLQQCVENPQRSATLLDLGFYNLVRNEPNITLLMNTTLVAAECDGKRIHRARAVRHSTEEEFEIEAKAYIDCTGDGRLGLEAGAAFVHGREERERYGEQHAQDVADKKTLGSSLLYQARRHELPMPYTPPVWARKFTAEDLRLRLRIDDPTHEDGLEYGFWWAEWGGELDTIADNEHIRDELLAILFGVWDFIKNSGRFPQSANWALDWFGWNVPNLYGIPPRIQQILLRNDAFLPGVRNQDPQDFAPLAHITADSERSDASAQLVCSGFTRATHGPGGTIPEQTVPGLHRWMSQSLPATLELRWETPVRARAVQLIFDTGLHRILTLSQSDKLTARMVWGQPQPETVRDYDVEVYMNDRWRSVTQQRGNYQRRNRLLLDPQEAFTRLRIQVLATHGLDHARICEVRVLT